MKRLNSYVSQPGAIKVYPVGDVPLNPDTDKLNESLIRQNICLLCRTGGKTATELAELTGIPMPYLEYYIDWLTEREFLIKNRKHYHTSFIIMNRRYFKYRRMIYTKYRERLHDKIIGYFWEKEANIRQIGFHGSDFPTERLMWAIITMFVCYAGRNDELLLQLNSDDNYEIQSDGGIYNLEAIEYSDGHDYDISGAYNHSGWDKIWGIACDKFAPDGMERHYWLGVYNFVNEEYRPEIITGDEKTQALLYRLYCSILEDDFSPDNISPEEQEMLAVAFRKGLIRENGNSYKPKFVVFTKEQLKQLQDEIYAPLLELISLKLHELAMQFEKKYRAEFPKAKQGYINHHVYMATWMFGIFSLIFAAEDGKICLPKNPANGASLTLVLVR